MMVSFVWIDARPGEEHQDQQDIRHDEKRLRKTASKNVMWSGKRGIGARVTLRDDAGD
jgi:hypothetical protein